VAAAYFKLLAYKDEYEVARLMTDADATAAAREVAGARGRLAWRLHPPILRAMGLRKKIAIGTWATPLVRLLARLRGLRGTPFDVFGYAEVRRLERILPGEYEAVIERVLALLTRENHASAIALAELPERVRGYEQIKLARIAEYREAMARAESELRSARRADRSVVQGLDRKTE
jgi:indolepyruvate ferredoxin oxidoreductase